MIDVSKLTDLELDYWVAKAENIYHGEFIGALSFPDSDDILGDLILYSPSTNWAQGGPIIERENISLSRNWNNGIPINNPYDCARAQIPFINGEPNYDAWSYGPNVLIAAMRCFVFSKFNEK